MSKDRTTFSGTWTRPPADGMARTRRESEDRASYDQQPTASSGCGPLMITFLLMLLAVLTGVVLG